MIGWLNEINRLASKGKREDREPGAAARGAPARPGPEASAPAPSRATGRPPAPFGLTRQFRIWGSTHGESLRDLKLDPEGASAGRKQGGLGIKRTVHLGPLHWPVRARPAPREPRPPH